MRKMSQHLRALALTCLLAGLAAAPASAAGAAMDRYVELLRADVKSEKTAVLTEALALSDAESKAFWPIYREYDLELTRLGDERYHLIKQYAKAYEIGTVQDQTADELARRWLKLSDGRQALWEKYYKKVARAVSPMRAAQFLQAEHQLSLLIDLAIATEVPFIEKSKKP